MPDIETNLFFPGETTPAIMLKWPEGTSQAIIDADVAGANTQIENITNFANRLNITDSGFRLPDRPAPTFRGPTGRALRESRGFGAVGQGNPSQITFLNNAEEAGVDTRSGLDSRGRYLYGLLKVDPETAQMAVDNYVRNQITSAGIAIPEGVPVTFIDQYTNTPAYLRPVTAEDGTVTLKPTLINPPGIEPRDIIEFSPEAGAIAIEGLMGAAGAAAPYISAVAGPSMAAAGAYFTPAARRALAIEAGVPENIANKIDTDDQFNNAMWSLGSDAAVAGLFALRKAKNMWSGAPFSNEDIPRIRELLRQGTARVTDFKRATGVELRLSMGALTGDPLILQAEQALKASALGETSRELSAASTQLRMDMIEGLKRLHENAAPAGRPSIRRAGEGVTTEGIENRAAAAVRQPIEQAERAATAAQVAVTNRQVTNIFNIDFFKTLQQTNLATRLAEVKGLEENIWKQFDTAVKVHPYTQRAKIRLHNPQDSIINQTALRIAERSKGGLSTAVQSSRQRFAESLGFKVADPSYRYDLLANEYLDFNHLVELQSVLRRDLHRINMGEYVDGWDAKDLNDMINAIDTQIRGKDYYEIAIEEMRDPRGTQVADQLEMLRGIDPGNEALRKHAEMTSGIANPISTEQANSIYELWQNGIATTRLRHQVYENETVSRILRKDINGKDYVMGPQAVRQLAFKNNQTLNEILAAIDYNPEVRKGLVEEFVRYANESVFINGKASAGAFAEFINKNYDMMNTLGLEGEMSSMASIINSAGVAVKHQTVAKNLVEQTFGINLMDVAPIGKLGRQILTSPAEKVRAFATRMQQVDPQLWETIKGKIATLLYSKFANAANKEALPKQMRNVLNAELDNPVLSVVFGPEYIENLKIYHDMVEQLNVGKLVTPFNIETRPPGVQYTRRIFGPLDPNQRFITALSDMQRKYSNRNLAELFADPERLNKFVKIRAFPPGGYGVAVALTDLGFSDLLTQEEQDAVNKIIDMREKGQYVEYARMRAIGQR